jgi:hypothetical protein
MRVQNAVKRHSQALFLVTLCACIMLACSSEDAQTPQTNTDTNATQEDTQTHNGNDTNTSDTFSNTATDASSNTATDASSNTATDASSNTATDASSNTATDASSNTATDTSSNTATDTQSNTAEDSSSNTATDTQSASDTAHTDPDVNIPPLPDDACQGYATRYWDCCKAHCGWDGNVPDGVNPVTSCNQNNTPQTSNYDATSSCNATGPNSAYTCYNMAPWEVSDTVSYGFAAVPAQGDICGRCYQLEFSGASYNAGADPGSAALLGKTMIVQATNIGHDVGNGQFDILIPGGGVGLFDACTNQWGVNTSDLGATYGGMLSHCKQTLGNASHTDLKNCVRGRCEAVFDEPSQADLLAGCLWFTNWYELADNPSLSYQEVACPQEIVNISNVDRRSLNDIQPCTGGGGSCTPEQMAQCDCGWTNNGANCGTDDGSCCWRACCGQ